ncbi:MAG TPA: glycosyltransferase [Opitutus sp.]|nr:glycosyltransferase [Opitutus sp.]
MPRTSVIMPCFNHGRFVSDSARSVLDQTDEDLELIVVDDCSSDDSWEVIQRIARADRRVKPIRHEHNLGASRSRNDGLRTADGEFVAFCDADDAWERTKLEIQLLLLRKHPDYAVTYCDTAIIDGNGSFSGARFSDRYPLPKHASGSLFNELLPQNFINITSVLARRDSLPSLDWFDEQIQWVEDWWCWIRLSRDHRFLYSPLPLARYRVHSDSTNVVQKRGAGKNRTKVFCRILRHYPDLTPSTRAEILRNIGGELCDLDWRHAGQNFLRQALILSLRDFRGAGVAGRSLYRLLSFPRLQATAYLVSLTRRRGDIA